ncbi:hypothetical protein [Nocardioides exalbidus]|nr:hypothetical protein [Nocardioides exalbidus]
MAGEHRERPTCGRRICGFVSLAVLESLPARVRPLEWSVAEA